MCALEAWLLLGAAATLTSTTTTSTPTAAADGPSAEALAEIARALATDTKPPPAPSGVLAAFVPDIALLGSFALAAFSEDENLQAGGHDPVESGFNLQQLELTMSHAVDPYFRFDAAIVFSLEGVEIEEAYATTLGLPLSLQARAGQFSTRFGRINAQHLHAWAFSDQPFMLSRVFGGEGNRGLGVELSWLSPLPWYLELVVSSNMAAGEGTARSFYGEEDLGVEDPLDLASLLALKQFFPISGDVSLSLGLSAIAAPNGFGGRTELYGADLYLKYRPLDEADPMVLSLETEWIYRRRKIPDDALADVTGYAQVVWRFFSRWSAAARFELGTPASGDVPDPLDPEWTERRDRSALALTFHPTEFSRLRLQGSIDRPGWIEDPILAAFLTLEVGIGAHAAHVF